VAYVFIPDIFIKPFEANADPVSFAEIHTTTVVLLRFVAFYSLFDSMNVIFASAIRGAGDTRFIMFMLLVLSVTGLIIPTYVAVMVLDLGLYACWVIMTVYAVVLGFSFFLRFLGGKWQSMRVIEKQL
jgi:MATE family multidrug resistance protein